MIKMEPHKWTFRARFRRSAFGWRSQPAIKRIKEAVAEIKKAARKDPILGAEGAILLLEKLSPALEQVDSSSGAIGTAVNNAIDAMASVIAKAPADDELRDKWLERLWDAITGMDVWAAYNHTMKAAENAGVKTETFERVRKLVAGEVSGDRFVTRVLGRELGLNYLFRLLRDHAAAINFPTSLENLEGSSTLPPSPMTARSSSRWM